MPKHPQRKDEALKRFEDCLLVRQVTLNYILTILFYAPRNDPAFETVSRIRREIADLKTEITRLQNTP
jgi:hypothetical protein